ncbi:MAG: PLP-dependent aminotransferase family protein [Peptoniphilaceae bacterium]|nr:PLP-dependent aminotransferase family protein [Peptoniphilaceae bacterium]MDY3738578.1 PLP-dependent aminotransferase family protein [Peptoniphilaceae bacterium]
MNYKINKKEKPIYLQVYKKIRDDIINGVYPFNKKLPSKRLLADEIGVSTVTVEHAYSLLCEEGYVKSVERSGFFVTFKKTDGFAFSNITEKVSKNRKISTSSYPNFSISILSKTMRKVISEYYDVILDKSPNKGTFEFRNAIKQYLFRNRAMNVDVEQIIIGSGAEYLYTVIAVLLGKDKTFAIESPSYEKIEKIYSTANVKYELLPLSDDGIESKALMNSKADVLHTTPYQSFPSGITASATKRHEYINRAKNKNHFIIESDYGSEFSISSQPMETLFNLSNYDNVIYLNTFSKTISYSMRVSYMVLPKKLVNVFQEKLGFLSCSVPTFEQYVLTELLNNGDFERHINRVRRNLRKKLNRK